MSPLTAPNSTNCGDVNGAVGNDGDSTIEDVAKGWEYRDEADNMDGDDMGDLAFGDNDGVDNNEAGCNGVGRCFFWFRLPARGTRKGAMAQSRPRLTISSLIEGWVAWGVSGASMKDRGGGNVRIIGSRSVDTKGWCW
jgi:hypothetical protein